MKIGIDIDDTITDTHLAEIKVSEKYQLNMGDENLYAKYSKEIYELALFKPGVKEAFDYLKMNGYQIIIITAREYRTEYDITEVTETMFKKYAIPYDQIIYHSIPKGPDAFRAGIKLFIDDLDKNLESVASYGIPCIKFASHQEKAQHMKQFNNWYDLLLYLKTWGEENFGK